MGDSAFPANGAAGVKTTLKGSAPTGSAGIDGTPVLPDREWETSPVYLALSARVSKTEQTLSTLSAQVASLTSIVKNLTGPSLPHPSAASRAAPMFSPFEGPDPAKPSPFIPAQTAPKGDPTVSALTTQIAALSASVAQLQRLQQTQGQLTRQNSTAPNTVAERQQPFGRIPEGISTPGGHMGNNGGMVSPVVTSSSAFGGGNRPNINRSMSSSVIPGGGNEGAEKWGAPKFAIQNASRDWSPGPGAGQGPVTPGGINGAMGQTGAAAPGAGIVVTKWDHLNLKVELLRSISKYG